MKILIYKNNKWFSLKMSENFKERKRPKLTLTEEKAPKGVKLNKDVKSAKVLVDDKGKVLKIQEKKEPVKPRVRK